MVVVERDLITSLGGCNFGVSVKAAICCCGRLVIGRFALSLDRKTRGRNRRMAMVVAM